MQKTRTGAGLEKEALNPSAGNKPGSRLPGAKLALAIGILLVACRSGAASNLLVNPGNDEALVGGQLPGWTEAVGSNWTQRASDPLPQAGTAYFFAGAGSAAELMQDVDVSAYAASIDGLGLSFQFEGFVSTWGDGDTSRVVVEYRDAANSTVLASYDSGTYTPDKVWTPIGDTRRAPAGTRHIRVRLIAARAAGTNNDGYFDSLSLAAHNPWTWRRTVGVTNSTDAALADHQALVTLDTAALVAADKLRADGADLRVTDAQNTPAPFWVEPGTINTTNTRIWVSVPSMGATSETLLYLWYGADETNSAASFDDTFTKDFEDSGASGIWHLDGDTLDASGNANNGTLNGATWQNADGGAWGGRTNVTFSSGKHLYFDGNDIVTFPDSPSLNLTNTLSVEAWIKMASWGNYARIFVKGGYPTYSPNWQYALGTGTDSDDIVFYVGMPTGLVAAATTGNRCVPNVWYHVAGTYEADTGAVKIFVNGELAGTNTTQGGCLAGLPAGPSMGAQANNQYEHFSGFLDEARIYDRCLPAGEVRAHAERRKYAAQEPLATVGAEADVSAWPWISGRVTDAVTGEGVDGVTVNLAGNAGAALTAGGGYYSLGVSPNWTGTATPSFISGTFSPTSRNYSDVTNDWAGQDFTWASGLGGEILAWMWRMPVLVSNSTAQVLSNFQVRVELDTASLIQAGKMRSDGGDIRVLDDQFVPLPYWLEPGTINTTNTRLWVKAATLAALDISILQLVYGKADAVSLDSFDDTFTKDLDEADVSGVWHLDGDALDSSGNTNSGTLNGPTWQGADGGAWGGRSNVTFSTGQHLYSDGNNDTVTFPNSDSLNVTNSVSVEAWMKIAAWGNYCRIFVKGQYPTYSPTWQYGFVMGSDANDIAWSVGRSAGAISVATTGNRCLPNLWYHVVGTYDAGSGTAVIYINGEAVGTNITTASGLANLPVGPSMGAQAGNGYEHFNGYLDEARIYNRCLTAGEVKAHAERRKYASQEPVVELGSELPNNDVWHVISGRATNTATGAGVDGVTVSFSGGAGSAVTAGGGYYSNAVWDTWSGTASPTAPLGSLAPPSRSYVNVTNDLPAQDFAFQAEPPSAFLLLSPTNGASDVARPTLLDWQSASFAQGYRVYLGTNNPPDKMAEVQGSEATASNLPAAVHYWYVEATNVNGTSRAPESGTWSFGVRTYDVTITGACTIAAADASYDHRRILVNGGTVTVYGVHTFEGLALVNGARLTHAAATATNEFSLNLTVSGTLSVDTNSAIDVSGKGYLAGRTWPNTTNGASGGWSGGSYGGLGGISGSMVGSVYGDFRNPNEPGSGSGNYRNNSGGGLARITASRLELNGSLLANGGGGASGGGVFLDVETLAGSGVIEAKGGYDGNGGGGGGRIALYYGTNESFELTNRVNATGASGTSGSAGTIYLKRDAAAGELIINSFGLVRNRATPLWVPAGTNYYEGITIVGTGQVVEVQSDSIVPPYTIVRDRATLIAGMTYTCSNLYLVNGATGIVDAACVFSNVYVTGGSKLTHSAATTTNEYRLHLAVSGTLSVDTNSAIDVSGKGYLAGRTWPNTTNGASVGWSGGSYGGLGGLSGSMVGSVYGDFRNPNEPGSGSGNYRNNSGGGLARITASRLELNGSLLANGGGGASGGGVFLDVETLAGSGVIEAKGGYDGNGGGGGGRIALYYGTNESFELTNRVNATGASGTSGSAGTIYLKRDAEAGELIINSFGLVRNRATPLWVPEGTNYHEGITILGTGQVVEVQSDSIVPPYTIVRDRATLIAGMAYTCSNLYLVNGATGIVDAACVFSNVYVTGGSKLTHSSATATNEYRLNLAVSGTLSVDTNSAIDVSGKGYLGGRTWPNTTNNASTGWSGGSYGGLGGANSGTAGPVYGDFRNPNEPGSGSGNYQNNSGGGLARITAGRLELNGSLLANGAVSASGGGVCLDVETLTGSGVIEAKGGSSGNGGGGGGRIAIYYQNSDFGLTNKVSAAGGTGSPAGGTGTVYIANQMGYATVSRVTPSGYLPGPVANMDIEFGSAIQADTFTLNDLVLTGPGGSGIGLTNMAQLDPVRFRVDLASVASQAGIYTLTVGTNVQSLFGSGLEQVYTNTFVLITDAPNPPAVTNFVLAPVTNWVQATNVVLAGTRDENTAVWLNGSERVANGSGPWSYALAFTQGINYVTVFAKDLAANASTTNGLVFLADTVAPVVTNVSPANGAFTNASPSTVTLTYVERISGLNFAASTCSIKKGEADVPGEWNATTNTVAFTPSSALDDGLYTISANLRDYMGNSATFSSSFTRMSWPYEVIIASNLIIAATNTTYDQKSVLVKGATVTIEGPHAFSNLYLINGATATHSSVTTTSLSPLAVSVSDTLFVSVDSAVDVSGKGYLMGRTHPNTTNGASTGLAGGSYGGLGGSYGTGMPNAVYGDFRDPNEPGSGSGPMYAYGNQAGGGLTRITAGELILDGSVKANGMDSYYGRGSGGGIYLNVGRLSGSGQIQAVGGRSTANNGGGGGGGRIAIYYDELNGFDPTNQASAAGGHGSGGGVNGGAGTLYLEKSGGRGMLVLDRKTGGAATTPFWLPGGTNYLDDVLIQGTGLVVEAGSAGLAILHDVSVDGATLVMSNSFALAATNLTLTGGAVVTHVATTTTIVHRVDLTVPGTLSVNSNSMIDVSGRGYLIGRTHPNTTNGASTGQSGGSYGGLGGTYGTGAVNAVYGDFRNPNEPGSGSAPMYAHGNQAGGGLVRITAGELILDGSVKANGMDNYYGRGSGGGVYLNAGRLSGSGQILAVGGRSTANGGGGGGGGRVAIYYDELDGFDPTNQASAVGGLGSNGGGNGGAGTLYLEKSGERGILVLDRKTGGAATTPFWLPEGTNYLDDVTIRGTGLVVEAGSTGLAVLHDVVVDGATLVASNAFALAASNLTLTGGAVLTHVATTTTAVHRVDLTISGTLSISSNSMIDVRGKGYLIGRTHPNTTNGASTGNAGASYGGLGGNYSGGVANSLYGDNRNPNEPGSGGGPGASYGNQAGGGLVRLTAGELVLHGSINASAWDGWYGRGSGGGIFLDVARLSGSGQLLAVGGRSNGNGGGGGGGGRIAVYYGELVGFDLTNQVSVTGGLGSNGGGTGGTGTVYISNTTRVRVTAMTPSGPVRGPVGQIELTFLAGLDPATFGLDDVTLTGPQGSVAFSELTQVSPTLFRLAISPALSENGIYNFVLGTNLFTTSGNPPEGVYTNGFVIDSAAPAAPVVTNWPAPPATNWVRTTAISLKGTREADTAVWWGGQRLADYGGAAWTAAVTLAQGLNPLSYYALDRAENASPTNQVWFFADSVAPSVGTIFPANTSHTNASPPYVRLTYTEGTSGLDPDRSTYTVKRDEVTMPGAWVVTTTTLTFTPAGALLDGAYNVPVKLIDRAGNTGSWNFVFTVDAIPPAPPVVHSVTSPTTIGQQTITGTKENGISIRLNGVSVFGGGTTNWWYEATLSNGLNQFSFTARDYAGNESAPTNVAILYDDTAPGPVTVMADGDRDGMSVALNWLDYNEMAAGADIDYYTIYRAETSFTNMAQATSVGTRPSGQKTFVATNLLRNTTYHFAVVATDRSGQFRPDVTSVPALTRDDTPPANPSNLRFDCFASNLVVRWTPPTDTDLAGLRMYFNNSTNPVALGAAADAYDVGGGLARATAYPVRVTAYDNDQNESAGATGAGITWLLNPTNVTVDPYSGLADLAWSASLPTNYVKHYAIYVSTGLFNSVEGMTARVTRASTTGAVAGLINDQLYYFVVAAVNLSGGMDPAVTTVSATPRPDAEGPTVSIPTFDGRVLTNGLVIAHPGTLAIQASDRAGVAWVKFEVDGTNRFTALTGPNYTWSWNVVAEEDGAHEIRFIAYDTLENTTETSVWVNVALAPPTNAPTLLSPSANALVNTPMVTVSGTADPYASSVTLYLNGVATGSVAVATNGAFSMPATLAEGTNTLRAAAGNRAGEGPLCSPLSVILDTSIPSAPKGLSANGRESGLVQLSWLTVQGASGYWIYRSASPFAATGQATRLNQTLWTSTAHQDVPASDGTYYYRVASENAAGTRSELSSQAEGHSDRTAPRVEWLSYVSDGLTDTANNRYGRGTVQVRMAVSEPLQAVPFFSLNVAGGQPINIALRRDTTNTLMYTGSFRVEEGMGGLAYAVFSGRDAAGNRGTEVESGGSLVLDGSGPVLGQLEVTPAAPIANSGAGTSVVSVLMVFDPNDTPQGAPSLAYRLTSSVTNWTELVLSQLTGQSWAGALTLPAAAGSPAEYLEFEYEAMDDLANTGRVIASESQFQVYRDGLPPLDPPAQLTGEALSGGRVRLSWTSVAGAADYAVFMGAASNALSYWTRSGNETEWIGAVGDATNWFAVASVREANSQTATSAWSEAVQVISDAVPPVAPANVRLRLIGSGMYLEWAPAPEGGVRYAVYRAATCPASITGLAAVVENVSSTNALDRNPPKGSVYYVVTARDAAGNESAPSSCAFTNVSLLPVNGLRVRKDGGAWPVVTWTHPYPQEIDGFRLYGGEGDDEILVGEWSSSRTNYIDSGYQEGERLYTVAAYVMAGTTAVESVSRSVLLTPASLTLSTNFAVKRGVMNRLHYTVGNNSAEPLADAQLSVMAGGHSHPSERFALEPGGESNVSVVVGGYTNLPAVAVLTNILAFETREGEVELVSLQSVAVDDDRLAVEVANDEMIQGATAAKVRFILRNTSEEEVEVMTARENGSQDSSEVRVQLEDRDGNVISVVAPRQILGGQVVTLPGRTTMARVAAGASFTSADMLLPVPTNTPREARLRLVMDRIHYHYGEEDQVSLTGMSATRDVVLLEPVYSATVTNVSPTSSVGPTNFLIQGYAVNRATGNPQQNAPVKVVISVRGFVRENTVSTDNEGNWSYEFDPIETESGHYTVWAVHPSVVAMPEQAAFDILKVDVRPTTFTLNMPRNYLWTNTLTVTASEGLVLTNPRVALVAEDQPGGTCPTGIEVAVFSGPAQLTSERSGALRYTLRGDNSAPTNVTLVLRITSDEAPAEGWARAQVVLTLAEAVPVLAWTPSYMEAGVKAGAQATAVVRLENRGHAAIESVRLSAIETNGNPAPDWVRVSLGQDLGDLAPAEYRDVQVEFRPPSGQPDGTYEYRLQITSSNAATRAVPLYVDVDNSGRGSAIFKVTDIYTGTTNQLGQLVQGLQGASILLQRESGVVVETNKITDALGEAYFADLPEGTYQYRVAASGHDTRTGRLRIEPGLTATAEVLLMNQLVTFEWSVREIAIEDRYEIDLSVTYQTDVPAAVVELSPALLKVPTNMAAGDVLNGEVRLVNHGLIRAINVRLTPPNLAPNYKIELMAAVPGTIEAKQVVRIPYRLTCLQSALDQDAGGGGGVAPDYSYYSGGGGGGCYTICGTVYYGWICINGAIVEKWGTWCGTLCPSGGGGEGGGGEGGYWEDNGPGGGTYRPPQGFGSAEERACVPDVCFDSGPCCHYNLYHLYPVDSYVDLISGGYTEDIVDLAVKVRGGTVGILRVFPLTPNRTADSGNLEIDNNPRWQFTEMFGNTRVDTGMGGPSSVAKEKGEVHYRYTGDGNIYLVEDHYSNTVMWMSYVTVNGTARVAQVRDMYNREVSYSYDNKGRMTNVVDALGGVTAYRYDAQGRLEYKKLPSGKEREIKYHGSGMVKSLGDTKFTYYWYPESGSFDTSVSKDNGLTTSYSFNAQQQPTNNVIENESTDIIDADVIEAWDPNGELVRVETVSVYDKDSYGHDNEVRIVPTRAQWAGGGEARYEYDEAFRLTSVQDEKGPVATMTYDENGWLAHRVSREGTGEEMHEYFTYNEAGLVETYALANGSNEVPRIAQSNRWDSLGNLVAQTDPWGNTTTVTYGPLAKPLSITNPDGQTWTYKYDRSGRLTSLTDPYQNTISNRYDSAGRLTWQRDAMGYELTVAYVTNAESKAGYSWAFLTNAFGERAYWEMNNDGQLKGLCDFDGQKTTYSYDMLGRPVPYLDEMLASWDPDGRVDTIIPVFGETITVQYYGSSEVPASMTTPSGSVSWNYDEAGRIAEQVITAHGESRTNRWTYDARGRVLSYTDAEGRELQLAYNLDGYPAAVADALGRTNLLAYNPKNQLMRLTDRLGRETAYESNEDAPQQRVVYPNGTTTVVTVNWRGLPVKTEDPSGRIGHLSYDAYGHMTNAVYEGAGQAGLTNGYVYDAYSRMTGHGNGLVHTVQTYDDTNKVQWVTTYFGAFSKTIGYGFDRNGHKRFYVGPDGTTCTYLLDGERFFPRAMSVAGLGVIQFDRSRSYRYGGTNRVYTIRFPGGVSQQLTYNCFGLVQSNVVHDPAGLPLMARSYRYNRVDELVSVETEQGSQTLEYDALGRLTQAVGPGTNTEAFGYDAVGNISPTETFDPDWQYDEMDCLTNWPGGLAEYDAAGRMTRLTLDGQTRQFGYNAAGNLAEVRDGEGTLVASYAYDALGRRVRKEAGGQIVWYLYADEGLVGEYDEQGNALREYVYKPDGVWMTDPLLLKQQGQYYYFLNDSLGTPEKLVTPNGLVVWSASRSAFGLATVDEAATVSVPLRFSGQYYDDESGLHYNTYRYYQPRLGRYIQPDPLGHTQEPAARPAAAGSSAAYAMKLAAGARNLYAALGNAPWNLVDPLGLKEAMPEMAPGSVLQGRASRRDGLTNFKAAAGAGISMGKSGMEGFISAGCSVDLQAESVYTACGLKLGFDVAGTVYYGGPGTRIGAKGLDNVNYDITYVQQAFKDWGPRNNPKESRPFNARFVSGRTLDRNTITFGQILNYNGRTFNPRHFQMDGTVGLKWRSFYFQTWNDTDKLGGQGTDQEWSAGGALSVGDYTMMWDCFTADARGHGVQNGVYDLTAEEKSWNRGRYYLSTKSRSPMCMLRSASGAGSVPQNFVHTYLTPDAQFFVYPEDDLSVLSYWLKAKEQVNPGYISTREAPRLFTTWP